MRCSSQPSTRCASISTKKSSTTSRIPGLHCAKILGQIHRITVHWCNLKVAQKKGLQFYQTRSNAIVLYNPLLAICIENVVYMKSGEELYNKVYQSPRLPRKAALKPNLHHGRQDFPNLDARTSADESEEYGETRGEESGELRIGNIDFRMHGSPHSTIQKEDDVRRETVKKLIHQFETHPNRESLMADLNKNQKFNLLSEESKELIRSMGNTEYFELCEMTCKIQCSDCSLFWEIGIEDCTCGECLQPSERYRKKKNKERFDVLSIQNL